MSMTAYDSWKTTPPEPKKDIVDWCIYCDEEIENGDPVYKVDDILIHEDCFFDFAVEELHAQKGIIDQDGDLL